MRISDWSSDVCSSDLHRGSPLMGRATNRPADGGIIAEASRTGAAAGASSERPSVCAGSVLVMRSSRATNNGARVQARGSAVARSEEHTSELQSLMRILYAVFCLQKKKQTT